MSDDFAIAPNYFDDVLGPRWSDVLGLLISGCNRPVGSLDVGEHLRH
ncbi:hypothetical protein [Ilumatobacter sp.]